MSRKPTAQSHGFDGVHPDVRARWLKESAALVELPNGLTLRQIAKIWGISRPGAQSRMMELGDKVQRGIRRIPDKNGVVRPQTVYLLRDA